jgi:protein O-mannosyl-transferase
MSSTAAPPKSTAQPRAAAKTNSSNIAMIALLAVVIFAIYFPALRGGFLLDDEDLLQRWGTATWQQIWFSTSLPDYWPLTESMVHIEWNLWGMQTLGYHVVNVLLHLAATLMIWRILKMLSVPGAFVAALLFAVHPVNVESVAWIVQRKNTLAMVWFLASAYFYLRMETSDPKNKRLYWLSLGCFALALLSKIAVVVLPPLLLLMVWWRRPLTKSDFLRVAPFFASAVIFSVINMWFMSHANAEGIRSATMLERILGAGDAICFYLYKAILPIDLAFIYPKWTIDANDLVHYAPLVSCAVMTVGLWFARNTKIGRPLFVAWLFFCIALAPVLGLTDTGFMKFSLVADHYQHFAIIAIVTLAGAGLARIKDVNIHRAAVGLIAAGLAFLALQQATIYKDAITLYRAAVAKNPTSWILHGNLADELLSAGQIEQALPEFRKTLELNPQSDDAHYFLATALVKTGAIEEALTHYNYVIKLPPEHYKFKAYHDMAMIYYGMGNKPQALANEEKAAAIARDHGFTEVANQSEAWMKAAGLK